MTLAEENRAIDWNALIDDVVAGRWADPETGKVAHIPCGTIVLAESLDGGEADCVAPLGLGDAVHVVCDENTYDAMGARVVRALKTGDRLTVLPGRFTVNESRVADLKAGTSAASALVAVGSGSVSDICKYVAHLDGKPAVAFGTAASMNGYSAGTASVTLTSGLKASLPATAPRGLFLDLSVSAAAPSWLSAAGLGDSLCRSTSQVDWWASHRLFGTAYSNVPYLLQEKDEAAMIAHAPALKHGDIAAVGYLHRVMTLCGFGVCFAGSSHPGSMGEHLVSHWIDMFAGDRHPGTTHGQQVGVASIAMARLQQEILALEKPPVVRPVPVPADDLVARYGDELGRLCADEMQRKAMDEKQANDFNARLDAIWPDLRRELSAFVMPADEMAAVLASAGGPVTASELGLDADLWADALRHSREIRGRWSFLDLAAEAGILEDFIAREAAR
ncbi:MAG: iron-containing alcohol dehydrogenase [Rhodobiaceae bacterium]|nr:iron-containing alcohol dehydrogenase [Rhodobiaceae bacterium]